MDEEKSVGEQFCDSLYQALAYSCKRVLEDDLKFPKSELYMYSEVFEHFELIMLKLQPFKDLLDYYDQLSAELVGFAITEDIKDFEISHLDIELLEQMKAKIEKEINEQKKLFGESSSPKNEKVVRCDSCENLRYNGICNYCALTMENYDSKDDLIDGALPKCPLKNKDKTGITLKK